MKNDGSELRRVTYSPGYESHRDWSPDGQRILFVSERDGDREIYHMNVDGTDVVRVTRREEEDERPDGSQAHPVSKTLGIGKNGTWSPDGALIAFQSWRDGQMDLCVVTRDGGNLRWPTHCEAGDYWPTWGPSSD